MLLFGTQILDWYWLTLLTVTAVAVSVIRARRRILTRYHIAQVVDRRLQLKDSLSTAWFLLSQPDKLDNTAARFQIRQAERSATSVDLATVFPLAAQLRKERVWALAGALGVAMFGLFAVRYLAQSRLSFDESLVPIHLSSVLERIQRSLAAGNHPTAYPDDAEEDSNPAKPAESEHNYEHSEVSRSDDPDVERQPSSTNSNASTTREMAAEESHNPQNGESKRSTRGDSQQPNPGDRTTEENREQTNPLALNANEDAAGRQPSSPGLLEKMKDAVSSCLPR